MPLPLSALFVAIPTLIYAAIVRRIDRFEQEPVRYVVAAFLWGAVPAAILALVVQLMLAIPVKVALGESRASALSTSIVAPVTEEIFKGLAVLFIYVWRRREFDGWVDGIVYGSSVGFGFAFVENILYLADAPTVSDWVGLFLLRVIVFGFMHGFYTSMTGVGFGLARTAPTTTRGVLFMISGLGLAILAHSAHNTSLVLADATGAATLCVAGLNYVILIVLMVALSRIGLRHEKQMFKTYLVDEVPDVISQPAYDALSNAHLNDPAYPKPHSTFKQLAGELAQRKQHLLRFGESTSLVEVDLLREKLKRMSFSAQEIRR